jgi:hypothetical protein
MPEQAADRATLRCALILFALGLLAGALLGCGGSDSSSAGGGGGDSAGAAVNANLPKSYQHPMGLELHYPESWAPQESNGTLIFVPAEAGRNADGPTESYFVLVSPSPGITSIRDPGAVETILREFSQMIPFLTQTGETKWIGEGPSAKAIVEQSGTAPTGIALRSIVYITARDGMQYALWAFGEAEGISRRQALAQQVFDSFVISKPQRDGSIAGHWSRSESMVSGTYTYAMAFEMDLNPDGTMQRSSRGVGEGFDNSDAESGTWSAAGGVLTIAINGGQTLNYDYKLIDGNLVLGGPGNRQIWSR